MTYLEQKQEIDQKMSRKSVNNAECAPAYTELILDMANKIESLEDELRNYKEEDWIKRAYGN